MKYYFLALATFVIVCVGCAHDGHQILDKGEYFAPPAAMMQRPGPMVDGPGPGVMPMLAPPAAPAPFATTTTQVAFLSPRGMVIGWQVAGGFAEAQLIAPGRYEFAQGATYRLKFTFPGIAGREGVALYPTLTVYPAHPTTAAYLAHNVIPIELTDEDLDQVEANNFVTKVIYLPDPRFQELAIAGVETLVSTRLEPGVDPVAEADRRGTIMVVLRVGNKRLEMPPAAGFVPGPGVVPAPPAVPGEIPPPPAPLPEGLEGAAMPGGRINQVAHRKINGQDGEHVPPMPIGRIGVGLDGVPDPMIVGGASLPGYPAYHPVAGMGPIPSWGMPITGTPIGLPGPPHLPLGGPAGLKSHTVINDTHVDLGEPVDHFLLKVKHEPGYRLPKPVKYVRYEEEHPVYGAGEAAYPAHALPRGAAMPGAGLGGYAVPGGGYPAPGHHVHPHH